MIGSLQVAKGRLKFSFSALLEHKETAYRLKGSIELAR